MPERPAQQPVTLFYSYAHEDEILRETLEKHLSLLQRQKFLSAWHDCQLLAGGEWAREIDEHLNTATIILLLISPDFLASDYSYNIMQRAMERHRRGEARVIPIILRPCSWQSASFGTLQALPRNGRAITTWQNQDEAFLEVEQSLRALIKHQPIARHSFGIQRTASQNRENMLLRLQQMYENLLADSLQEVAWIDLGLSIQPGAVQNAANLLLRRTTQTAHPLPPGTSIHQVYQEANQELLILGEPGAGKSTLLYQLGRDLLREAIRLPARSLPILFPLSSWAEKRPPLHEWMVEQLVSPIYEIPRKLSQQWVQQEQVLPLLDGLDEMEEAVRPDCIAAINAYRREHPLCPLVVCSRSDEYTVASVQQRLHLQSAIEVQPLTPAQVEATLIQASKPFAALQAELKKNTELRELARSPLWLNVLLLTFKNTPVQALPEHRANLQRHLFQRYVQRMVEQKGMTIENQKRYPLNITVRWLSSLAQQMRKHNQIEFAVEMLQPNWLARHLGVSYDLGIRLLFGLFVCVFIGVFVGPLAGLGVWQITGPRVWTIGWPAVALIFGLFLGPLCGLFIALYPKSLALRITAPFAERVQWSWRKAGIWLLGSIPLGLFFGWLAGGFFGTNIGLSIVLLLGVISILTGGLTSSQYTERRTFHPGEGLRRSRKNGLRSLMLFVLPFELIFVLLIGPSIGLLASVFFGLSSGLLCGMAWALDFGLFSEFQHVVCRFWLWRAGVFPWRIVPFLEDARARHLLQRVGGTYHFVHRLLLDYFADLNSDASGTTEAAGTPVPVVTNDDA